MTTRITLFLLLSTLFLQAQHKHLPIPFDKDKNATPSYPETIDFYKKLAEQSPQVELKTYGTTDSGFPLHLAILSKDKDFSPATIRAKNKRVLLVNNAIHAGEPCGVDATMMLFRNGANDKKIQEYLKHVVVVTIPFYNIGGGLNRGSYSRANQIGPHEHGFRGNAKNLDLNRDFIKADSKNAQTFNQLFNEWQPDVFIDNHTSNGADYPYVITMIATQKDKLDPNLSTYLQQDMLPALYDGMKKSNYEMTPYVFARNTPDDGIAGFLDLPRYSSGYAAMHNAISFISETHMLKPYEDRVKSTYFFMENMIKKMDKDYEKIKSLREKAIKNSMEKSTFDVSWSLDFEQKDSILFKGYTAKYKPSGISGLDRLYYDRNEPYEKYIPFFNSYKTTLSVEKPIAYIIPQAYSDVIDRLHWNGVKTERLSKNVELDVEMYRIEDYTTSEFAYEGHYNHSDVKVKAEAKKWRYHKGDYVIYTNQASNRYIVETLEPQATDSYFNWNFFDGILMQKEYFSSYVFEDTALEILNNNPSLKAELATKKVNDEEFAKSARAQLDFVYKRSPYYEATHNVYPVGRLVNRADLPLEKMED